MTQQVEAGQWAVAASDPDATGPIRPHHARGRSLSELAVRFHLSAVAGFDDARATGVSITTAGTRPGDLFAAVPGAAVHGASFAGAALSAGAVGMITDRAGADIAHGVDLPILVADDARAILGDLSAAVYETRGTFRVLAGVTGTNGKTSTVYVLEALMRRLGIRTGLSTTIEQRVGDLAAPSRLTTPEACDLHALLARMLEDGVGGAAVEISAQALTRQRAAGIVFDVAGFTNLTHDHLDEYGDMQHYLDAKVSLFRPQHARRGVVSLDSPAGFDVTRRALIPVATISSTPGVAADWTVEITDEHIAHTGFRLTGPDGQTLQTRVSLTGAHMAADAALAIVMLTEAGVAFAEIARSVDHLGIEVRIPGRIELVSGPCGPLSFVDICHTPDALLKTLRAVRRVSTGRVLTLIGADGDRDPTKRAAIGRFASENSDVVVITDHHSRFEDPARIRAMLREGAVHARGPAEVHDIPVTADALRFLVSRARPEDAIVWAGPGNSEYREVRGVRHPYSARNELRRALAEAGRLAASESIPQPAAG